MNPNLSKSVGHIPLAYSKEDTEKKKSICRLHSILRTGFVGLEPAKIQVSILVWGIEFYRSFRKGENSGDYQGELILTFGNINLNLYPQFVSVF